MAKPTDTGQQGTLVGTFASTTTSPWFAVEKGGFNLNLSGTFVATITLERSFDGGVTANPITLLGAALTFTAPCSEIFGEPEENIVYRLNCTWTSGTVTYRLSQ